MKETVNAVSTVCSYYTVSILANMILNNIAYLSESQARLYDGDSFHQSFVSHFGELFGLFVHFADKQGLVEITVEASVIYSHIDYEINTIKLFEIKVE